MWIYEKKLEYPVKITRPDPGLAKVIVSQLGGPDGELGASMRYLQQRYSMPYAQVKGALTDIGTEELAHMEIVSAILYQLTRNLTPEQIKAQGFDTYFVDHTTGVYPQFASGTPFTMAVLQVTGDTLADLFEDMAAEQKARLTYDNILRLAADNPEVKDPIKFLRAREVVHFQRFGECLRIAQDNLNAKNFYAFNPSFDKCCNPPDVVKTPQAVPVPAAQTIPSPCGRGTTTGCAAPAQVCVEPQRVEQPTNCGCNVSPCAPAMPPCGCTPTMPACGCAPKQNCCRQQPMGPCCDTPTTLPAVDYAPCGPAAAPYTQPYNKRMNRSCGCG